MIDRDPTFTPKTGDIVRSCYDAIGERHVIRADECGVKYYRVRPKGERREGYCLPGIWTKWCRAHRVEVIQLGT